MHLHHQYLCIVSSIFLHCTCIYYYMTEGKVGKVDLIPISTGIIPLTINKVRIRISKLPQKHTQEKTFLPSLSFLPVVTSCWISQNALQRTSCLIWQGYMRPGRPQSINTLNRKGVLHVTGMTILKNNT